jgi:hypothetical protein
MIPYAASDTDDAESILRWTNIGLIVLNFLVFFYELAIGATGPRERFSHRGATDPAIGCGRSSSPAAGLSRAIRARAGYP